MTDKNLPSIEYLHKRLRYEPETGRLFWRDCNEMPKHWRTRYADKEALSAINKRGYLHGSVNSKTLLAHRVAFAMFYGEWPSMEIDHNNGVPVDNRIKNLRSATPQQNRKNTAMRSDNTSGVCGVHWEKRFKKWVATIHVDGRPRYIGLFATLDEAAEARATAASKNGYTDRHGT